MQTECRVIRGQLQTKGVSLIELVVTIAVLAILLSLAVPALGRVMANSRAVTVANELQRSVALARASALQSGNVVEIRPVSGGAWTGGWEVIRKTVDAQGTGADELLLRSAVAGSQMLIDVCGDASQAEKLTFTARGFPTGAFGRTFKVHPEGYNDEVMRFVRIHPSGLTEVLPQAACT